MAKRRATIKCDLFHFWLDEVGECSPIVPRSVVLSHGAVEVAPVGISFSAGVKIDGAFSPKDEQIV